MSEGYSGLGQLCPGMLSGTMENENQHDTPTLIAPSAGQRGMTELHYAAYCNDADATRAQLELGTSPDIRDENGWTPLHWSVDMCQTGGEPEQVVCLLLGAGALANAIDKSGVSVLMMACGRNNEQIVEHLIRYGADVRPRSTRGTTALHEAAGCNFFEVIPRLLILGADPNQIDERGETAEQIAEQCGFEQSAAILKAARLSKLPC